MIIDLSNTKLANKEIGGGKAYHLNKLISFNQNVPKGFVVSPSVNLTENESEIENMFESLSLNRVAVRSSATVEDSKELSFAGQFDTLLNITQDTLIAKIQQCRDSISNPSVIAYCEINKVNPESIEVAVIIQEMIDSDASGVAFSMNPINGKRNEVVIEAVLGLGEILVSGMITPDSYIINTRNMRIIDKRITKQEEMITTDKKGASIRISLDPKSQERQKLTESQIINIARTVREIESSYGFPVDVEWAYKDNKLYILQSRPVTALK